MTEPKPEMDLARLQQEVYALISEEQGNVPFGLAVSKHLAMLPVESAWAITQFVVEQRSTLFTDESGHPDEGAVRAFTEGMLCGLRIRTAVAKLAHQ